MKYFLINEENALILSVGCFQHDMQSFADQLNKAFTTTRYVVKEASDLSPFALGILEGLLLQLREFLDRKISN